MGHNFRGEQTTPPPSQWVWLLTFKMRNFRKGFQSSHRFAGLLEIRRWKNVNQTQTWNGSYYIRHINFKTPQGDVHPNPESSAFPRDLQIIVLLCKKKRHLGPQKKDWTVQPHLFFLHTFESITFVVPNAKWSNPIRSWLTERQRMIGGDPNHLWIA